MASTDFIKVATDGPGKAVFNRKHPGAGPSGEDLFGQVTTLVDPDDPTKLARIGSTTPAAAAVGLTVRGVPPNFDSGMGAVPDTLTSITAVDTLADTLFVSNQTDFVQWITVTNAAGSGIYLNQRQIGPRDAWSVNFGRVKVAGGIKWQASAASAVQAQLTGWQ
jgi:hypothetical protein